jgi:hypothetical protein
MPLNSFSAIPGKHCRFQQRHRIPLHSGRESDGDTDECLGDVCLVKPTQRRYMMRLSYIWHVFLHNRRTG